MRRLVVVLITFLFLGSYFTVNNGGIEEKVKEGKVVATIIYRSNECSISTLQPLVVITQPEDGAVVTDPHLVVLGYASDEAGMNYWEWEWHYQGGSKSNSSYFETAEYVDFRIDIYGLHPGWNLVIVRFKNIYGAYGEDRVNVTYNPPDTQPPEVTIDEPEDGVTYNTPNVTLRGELRDNTGITSFGYTHEWDGGATGSSWPLEEAPQYYPFEIPITLHDGWNRIKVYGSDAAGNYGEDVVTVTYSPYNESPVIVIEYPEDGATFTEPNITVIGTATDNIGIVSIGSHHEWEDGDAWTSSTVDPPATYIPFQWNFTLHDGWNRITIFAEDDAGNTGEDNVMVYYNSGNIDLDIVWRTNNSELVLDNVEDNMNIHVPGRALSLNRGPCCLKRIYVRSPQGQFCTIDWSDKIEVYEDCNKTIPAIKGKQYLIPKEFWVEAIEVSNQRNDQWVEAILANDANAKDKVVFTNFQVDITVRCEATDAVSPQIENDRNNVFTGLIGQNTLGLVDYINPGTGQRIYGGAVEIMGQLVPTTLTEDDFFDDEFYWRQNYDERIYENRRQVSIQNSVPDDPFSESIPGQHERWQDVTPSNTGKIYYVDAPADPLPAAGVIKAVRLRFEVWCTFSYHEEPGPKGDANNNNIRPVPDCWRDCSKTHKWYVLRTTLDNKGRVNPRLYWQPNLLANGPKVLGFNWEWTYRPPNFWLWRI